MILIKDFLGRLTILSHQLSRLIAARPLKGLELERLTALLKRCPDPKLEFFSESFFRKPEVAPLQKESQVF